MKPLFIPLSLIALLGACAGTDQMAQSDQSGDSTMVASSEPDPDAMRCKSIIKTGTRINTRVCKTNRQWEQDATDSREATESFQRNSQIVPAGPTAGGG